MNRPHFLADHDLNEHLIAGVVRREPSIHFSRAREFALAEADDGRVLQYASEHGLLVVSHDVNTMTAAAYQRVSAGQPMNGLIWCIQWIPSNPTSRILS